MPELPEVETVMRGLEPVMVDKKSDMLILGVQIYVGHFLKICLRG